MCKSHRNYGFKAGNQTFLMVHHLETKFNISMNSRCSEGEQDLVFHRTEAV